MTIDEVLAHEGRFTVIGSPGIAWRAIGAEEVGDEDTEWTGQKVRTGFVTMIMVGDDREFNVDPEDIVPIDDDDYCHCCGQVGCQWDGRDRS